VVVCCSVLQRVVVGCSGLQWVAECCKVLRCAAAFADAQVAQVSRMLLLQ